MIIQRRQQTETEQTETAQTNAASAPTMTNFPSNSAVAEQAEQVLFEAGNGTCAVIASLGDGDVVTAITVRRD